MQALPCGTPIQILCYFEFTPIYLVQIVLDGKYFKINTIAFLEIPSLYSLRIEISCVKVSKALLK